MPNVLAFCVDEMRADHAACMGNPTVRTPNIDRLASRGVLFRRAYCNNPICMPARSTMFTGLLPRDHGVRVNGQSLRTDLPTLPGVLRENGYATHAAGKLHLTPWVPKEEPPDPARFPESLANWNRGLLERVPVPYYGFEGVDFVGGHTTYAYGEYVNWLRASGGDPSLLSTPLGRPSEAPDCSPMAMPAELHYNRFIADRTIAAMERASADRRPFFLWCSFPDPHHPFAPPEPYASMYDPADCEAPIVDEAELELLPDFYRDIRAGDLRPYNIDNRPWPAEHVREMIARTYGMVSHLDAEMGRVLDYLDRSGLADDTVVVFTGDHGDMMGDHGLILKGTYTFRGCINIPLIIVAPGSRAGERSDALVSQIDLMPTILDLCDVEMPGTEWTRRETPFVWGEVDPIELYPGRSVAPLLTGERAGERGGTRDAGIRDSVVIENDDPSTGFHVRALVTDRYRLTAYPGHAFGELFDLTEDPGERHNLWGEKRDLRDELLLKLFEEYAGATPFYPIPPWNS